MLNKKIWILSLIVISGLCAESNATVKTDTNTTVVENNSSVKKNSTKKIVKKSIKSSEKKFEKNSEEDIGVFQDIKNQLEATDINIENSKYNFVGDR